MARPTYADLGQFAMVEPLWIIEVPAIIQALDITFMNMYKLYKEHSCNTKKNKYDYYTYTYKCVEICHQRHLRNFILGFFGSQK